MQRQALAFAVGGEPQPKLERPVRVRLDFDSSGGGAWHQARSRDEVLRYGYIGASPVVGPGAFPRRPATYLAGGSYLCIGQKINVPAGSSGVSPRAASGPLYPLGLAWAGELPPDLCEVETQAATLAAEPNAAEFAGVRVDPIPVDAEFARDLCGVS
ncbi:MAG: hypothetical protein WA484_16710 [Solirubrobacteraceae bacterium]